MTNDKGRRTMVEAIRVVTSRGECLATHKNCIDGEAIHEIDVQVPAGTICDLCDEPITETQ